MQNRQFSVDFSRLLGFRLLGGNFPAEQKKPVQWIGAKVGVGKNGRYQIESMSSTEY